MTNTQRSLTDSFAKLAGGLTPSSSSSSSKALEFSSSSSSSPVQKKRKGNDGKPTVASTLTSIASLGECPPEENHSEVRKKKK